MVMVFKILLNLMQFCNFWDQIRGQLSWLHEKNDVKNFINLSLKLVKSKYKTGETTKKYF